MNNKYVSKINNCRNTVKKIEKLIQQRCELNSQLLDLESKREARIEDMNGGAAAIGLLVIVGNIIGGTNWILSIIIGCIVGFVIDIPFKMYRKYKYKKELDERQRALDRKSDEIDLAMAEAYKDKDFMYIKNILSDEYMTDDCLSFILDLLLNGYVDNIHSAFKMYLSQNEDDFEYDDDVDEEPSHNNGDESYRTNSETSFFVGCHDVETLTKRYKQLAKCFHPDTGIGDEDTMKIINEQYEILKKRFE